MRSLIGWLAIAVGVTACSSEEGALLVLSNPSNASITRLEVVLASTDDVVPTKQRISTQSTLDEDVRYYKQASTSRSVPLDGKMADGFTVRIAPNPGKAKYIPFVFGYAADDTLVAIGRVQQGDADMTPVPIVIPTGELDRFDVDLEPMAAPDPMVGIARNTGTTVTCARDSVKRGAAWKFGKGIQLRIIFAKPNEVSGLTNPYDLDCDGHDIELQKDCDDLEIGFNPDAPEVCGQPDYNCDGAYAGTTACTVHQGCPGHTACAAPVGPGPNDVCIPDPAAVDTDACFCPDNQCVANSKCKLARTQSGICEPATSLVADICRNSGTGACTVTVRDPTPVGWTVEVAHAESTSVPVFDTMAMMPAGSPSMYLRVATTMLAPAPPTMPVVLEVRSAVGTPVRYFIMLEVDSTVHMECPMISVRGPSGTAMPVDTMACAF